MHWAIETFMTCHTNDMKPHVITTNIEHCATELPLKAWQETGKIGTTQLSVIVIYSQQFK
jgi:cysteine sulfinate desulfinase/cysteine desulfurase-like protein